ncbi:hypothetical protein BSZ39_06005 [Bowdeniella nasicola]|uniref:Membrane protein DedA, SNARE-associated domain n=1 Tax=Bowdeniella nasicola TaxID=208480 RepID=A0A1Q5Q2N9_9ACTO|nr:hypothetical protein [Bowdeniella nasicola]OKL54066.1 hypothetical protein BSZ39_06005 [Bowdeniella nasicola]
MPQFVTDGPIWLIVGFLFVVVFCRAQATYWLARGVAVGTERSQSNHRFIVALADWFNGPAPRRGKRALEKWGIVIIPISFLTIGFQTAVNAAAGLLAMDWRRYTIAMLPGCVAWALLYGLGVLAVWLAVINAIAGSWYTLAALLIILAIALIVSRIVRARREAVDAG